MSNSFGSNSLKHRATLHGEMIKVLDAVIEESEDDEDFAIICGLRGEREQNMAFEAGTSKRKYPTSHHNGSLDEEGNWDDSKSDAADCIPVPSQWPDKKVDTQLEYIRKMIRFYNLAERILAKGEELGIEIQWGGLFDNFFDGPHFQLVRNV